MTSYRVITLLHNSEFDVPFIIKLLGGGCVIRKIRNVNLQNSKQVLTYYEIPICDARKIKGAQDYYTEQGYRQHKQLPISFFQIDTMQTKSM